MTLRAGRWAVLVLRELDYGGRRFSKILTARGAPRDMITTRLQELAHAGLIRREQYSQHPPRDEYHLTPAGEGLGPILMFLAAWGKKWGEYSDLTAPFDFRHADHHLSGGGPAHSAGSSWNRAASQPGPISVWRPVMSRWAISRGNKRAALDRSRGSSTDVRRAGGCG
ncbi:winged helix-turn-helix transcriptional regulator [Arthrobacter sp. TMN-37]